MFIECDHTSIFGYCRFNPRAFQRHHRLGGFTVRALYRFDLLDAHSAFWRHALGIFLVGRFYPARHFVTNGGDDELHGHSKIQSQTKWSRERGSKKKQAVIKTACFVIDAVHLGLGITLKTRSCCALWRAWLRLAWQMRSRSWLKQP